MEEEKPKKNYFKIILTILLLIVVISLLWARFLGSSGIKVREYKEESKLIPESFNGFKIVQISDIHYGRGVDLKKLENLVDKINELKPDLVVFTGDLIDKDTTITEEKLNSIETTLSGIDATIGLYAVKGNHDYENKIDAILNESGWTLLENDAKLIYHKGNIPILLVGLSSMIKAEPDYEEAISSLELSEEELANLYKIVILHEPDIVKDLDEYDINLILGGHSHQGQVRFPFIGAVVKVDGSKTYYEEYYKVNGTSLYISNGLGNSGMNMRLLNKPSFNFFRLYAK